MAKIKGETITMTFKIDIKISLWQAIKLRLIGVAIPQIQKGIDGLYKKIKVKT